MGELAQPFEAMQAAGIAVRAEPMHAAALRYFEPGGDFAGAVQTASGAALPGVLKAVQSADGELVLAWRSPTESLLLTRNAARLAQLEAQLAAAAGGCLVNLTGAVHVLTVTGERIGDLLCRLGGPGCVPAAGEAHRSRLADVPVLVLAIREGETRLAVDRAYAPHLAGWVRETLLDFPPA